MFNLNSLKVSTTVLHQVNTEKSKCGEAGYFPPHKVCTSQKKISVEKLMGEFCGEMELKICMFLLPYHPLKFD